MDIDACFVSDNVSDQPESLIHPLAIGSLVVPNNLALAPMAGTSDTVYRAICREMGAGLVVTELVSARGICYDPALKRSWRYLEIMPEAERPVAIQLFGADPDDFYRAIQLIHQHPILRQCDLIDLNMGCPVPKVVRGGEGSALMKDPPLAGRIIEASVRALAEVAAAGADTGPFSGSGSAAAIKPLTVKFRKGWDDQSVNAPAFARLCQEAGAAAVTIHARTRDQFYSGKADWSIITAVKQAVTIPVYGNGDIINATSARQMLQETGVDGLMIGRAAQGNPWIFQEITAELANLPKNGPRPFFGKPTPQARAAMVLRHLRGLAVRVGERTAVAEMRAQLAYYLRGTPQAAQWKNIAMRAKTVVEVEAFLDEWLKDMQRLAVN
ncbi:MAG: tRNA dihydrouridine synthase DusB [Clostridia bacterium]|nr:tRNA dihydrouridine synthase DusB [Clostridia bacterium]